jgi:hypothetical protein
MSVHFNNKCQNMSKESLILYSSANEIIDKK